MFKQIFEIPDMKTVQFSNSEMQTNLLSIRVSICQENSNESNYNYRSFHQFYGNFLQRKHRDIIP